VGTFLAILSLLALLSCIHLTNALTLFISIQIGFRLLKGVQLVGAQREKQQAKK